VPIGDVLGGLVTSGALAQALDGNEEDKAPSVKAVNEGLDGKLDKVESSRGGSYAYTVAANGQQMMQITNSPNRYVIPMTDKNGNLKTNTPKDELDAANRKYVDDGLATRLPLLKDKWPDLLGNILLYSQDAKGELSYSVVSQRNYDYYVPWFRKPKDCGATDAGGTIAVTIPVNPYNAAPKKYVDEGDAKVKRDLDAMRDFIYGSFVETDTQGFYNNPVHIHSYPNLLPFASLDMISTGFKPKQDAYKDIVEDLAFDGQPDVTLTKISTNKIKISTADYLDNSISVEAHLTESLSSGAKFKWRVSVVGGSYATQDGSTLNAADGMSLQAVNTWLVTNAGWEQNTILFAIGVSNGPVKYNDLELKFEVMAVDFSAVDFVPIFAVEVGGETVYTIPQEIRDITYRVLGVAGDAKSNVYGLAISENVYNYLDLDAKQYVINCVYSVDEDGEMHVVEHQDVIDVSAYLTDDDGFINISGGSEIYFVGEDGNSVGGVSPCQVTFLKDKGASIT
jgi:hypothetical protein